MADDVTLPGTGDVVAADEVGGVKYQEIKVGFGADNAYTGVTSTATNPLPVALSDVDNAVLDSIDTDTSTIAGDTTSIDGKITACNTGAVVVSSGAITETNSGAILADTASIDTNCGTIAGDTTSIDGKITACNTGAVVVSSGAITETNSTAILADTASMDTNLATLAGTVTASEVAVSTTAPATGNLELCKAEDAASAAGDVGIASLAVRDDTLAADAGTSADGDFTYHRVDNNGALWVNQSGGTSLFKSIDLDETEEEVKASAGKIYWIHATNLSASLKYLKVYNNTDAGVTVGTTVPDLTFPLPTQGDTNGISFELEIPNGITMDTGITVAATTGIADNDSGAPGANEVVVNIGYS